MAHEIHDDGFHEIQLSGKQLVFLFMATTVVSIVIFLCGVLVGRGVQNARGVLSTTTGFDADSTAPADTGDVAAAPSSGEPTQVTGLTYPKGLPAADGTPATVEPGAASDLDSTVAAPGAAAEPAPETPAPAAAKDAPRAAAPPPAVKATPPAPAAAPSASRRRPPRQRRLRPRTVGSRCRSRR